MKNNTQEKQRAKQQKSNIDKLDSVLANLPEAQYAHDEEQPKAQKRRGRPPKAEKTAEKTAPKAEKAPQKAEKTVPKAEKTAQKKTSGQKKKAPAQQAQQKPKKDPELYNNFWNKKKRGRPSAAATAASLAGALQPPRLCAGVGLPPRGGEEMCIPSVPADPGGARLFSSAHSQV